MTRIIEITDWTYECGDRCCSNYGTSIKVDGKEITKYFNTSSQQDWEDLFAALNIKTEIIIKTDYND
jgi:hypothetical protein